MKTKRSSLKKKKVAQIVTIAMLAALLLGVVSYFAYGLINSLTANQSPTTETTEDQSTDDASDSDDTDTDNLPDKDDDDQKPIVDGDDSVAPEDTSLESPAISRASVSGEAFKSVATFQKTKTGNCTFRFTATDAETLAYKSPIVVGPSYYYCSLSANINDFASSNSWTLTVIHKATSGSISSDPMEVTIP